MSAFAASTRTTLGTKATVALRASGQVPVTISQAGHASAHVSIAEKDAELLVKAGHLSDLSLDGKAVKVLVKEYQRHPIKDKLLHIDVQAVTNDTSIRSVVPLQFDTTHCPGVKAGGLLETMKRAVKIRCLAKDLPHHLTLDLSKVEIGQTMYAAAISLPAGVTLETRPRVAVCAVVTTRGQKKNEEEAAAATPAAAAAAPAPAKK